MPQRQQAGSSRQAQTNPCGNPDRQQWDVAGRINDLINCYLITAGEYIRTYLPVIIIAIVLLVIMILAARSLIED